RLRADGSRQRPHPSAPQSNPGTDGRVAVHLARPADRRPAAPLAGRGAPESGRVPIVRGRRARARRAQSRPPRSRGRRSAAGTRPGGLDGGCTHPAHRQRRVAARPRAVRAASPSRSTGLRKGPSSSSRTATASILAEVGGREVYQGRATSYSDFNRVTESRRQPGSAMKPIVYLAAFRHGDFTLETLVPDEPISVPNGYTDSRKWISNY